LTDAGPAFFGLAAIVLAGIAILLLRRMIQVAEDDGLR